MIFKKKARGRLAIMVKAKNYIVDEIEYQSYLE